MIGNCMTGKRLGPVTLFFVMALSCFNIKVLQWFIWLVLFFLWTVLILNLSLNVDEEKGRGAQMLSAVFL